MPNYPIKLKNQISLHTRHFREHFLYKLDYYISVDN